MFLPTYTQSPGQAALDALTVTRTQINANPSFVPAYTAAGFNGSNVVQFTPNGNSIYHGLATQVTRRMAKGLQFVTSYTYSHTIDDSTTPSSTRILPPPPPQHLQHF